MPLRRSPNTTRLMWATLKDNRLPIMLERGSPIEIARAAIQEMPDSRPDTDRYYDYLIGGILDRRFPPLTVVFILKAVDRYTRSPLIMKNLENYDRLWLKIRRTTKKDNFAATWPSFQKRLAIDDHNT